MGDADLRAAEALARMELADALMMNKNRLLSLREAGTEFLNGRTAAEVARLLDEFQLPWSRSGPRSGEVSLKTITRLIREFAEGGETS